MVERVLLKVVVRFGTHIYVHFHGWISAVVCQVLVANVV